MINDFFPPRPASQHVISRERSDREIFNPLCAILALSFAIKEAGSLFYSGVSLEENNL